MNATRLIVATAVAGLAAVAACSAPATRHARPAAPVDTRTVDVGLESAVAHGERTVAYVPPAPEPVTETAPPLAVAPRKAAHLAPTAGWSTEATPPVHFRTPEGAMRYLTRAYNARDLASLAHVTTPSARDMLVEMRKYAPDLRLTTCKADGGAYTCEFSHAVPHKTTRGSATLSVGPATRPGWYATVLVDCGDD
ncbi:MAG TPA: hypothetical protein VFQ85_01855 [Mycobacteriales bacterium]|jgi:hypothetical protein|nr:hypothetical protein [Mycobacteriales bacterium]